MSNQFFKINQKPEDYNQNSCHAVIRRDVWKRGSFQVGGVNVRGRASWGAAEPLWINDVIYYNTARLPIMTILNKIVIHHTNNSDSVAANEQKQKNRGYAALGYHFFISKDGHIYEGRPIKKTAFNVGEISHWTEK